jgi:hypothetical protein
MKVSLRKHPKHRQGIAWTACEPFVENSMAVLIHRVRYVTTHQIAAKYKPHLAVESWCGNSSTGTKKFTFLAEPPEGRILCARCEDAAVAFGHLSAESIAGRHVHTGGVIAVARCCELKGASHE